jgi:stress responsive alpha/beta barrel protein
MYRKLISTASLAVMAAVGAYAFVRQAPAAAASRADTPAPFVHVVIFYLKKDAPKEAADAIIADAQKLTKISSVRALWAGKPADKSTPVAAKDYHAALTLTFDDADGLQKYIDDPQHVEYAKKHRPNMEKVVVYDFINQK